MAALPKTNGPKLAPFEERAEERYDIEFLNRIGEDSSGYVWKVSIDGNVFALKMVS